MTTMRNEQRMKTALYALLLAAAPLPGCSSGEESAAPVPGGKVEVRPVLPGLLGSVSENGPSVRTAAARADGQEDIFFGKDAEPLPNGSTLWLHVKEQGAGGAGEEYTKSYVVRDLDGTRQALYPCRVEYDEEGNVSQVTETGVPLYLTIDKTYEFRAMSPAKRLVETDDGHQAVSVNHKEYLMATDDRYPSSAKTVVRLDGDEGAVHYVKLKPLAHQTSRLEFTIRKEKNDPAVFSLDVMPQGVEVSGVQKYYRIENEKLGWNWCWTKSPQVYLEAKTGDADERFTIRRSTAYADSFITNKNATELYIKCPILPTDAYSGAVVVLFNLSVNGIPTQYEMMLNQKVFEAAYTYHYVGTVKMENGVSTITWQYVSWNEELPIL